MVLEGKSGNVIYKHLQKLGLGVRKQTLQKEVRNIKGIEKKKDVKKYTRKDLLKKEKPKEVKQTKLVQPELKEIFRLSYIINDVPVHSKPFKRNYVGFRLTAFSFDPDTLNKNKRFLKEELVRLTDNYLGYPIRDWNYFNAVIVGGSLQLMSVFNPNVLNNRYFFKVEKEGKSVKGAKTGYLK